MQVSHIPMPTRENSRQLVGYTLVEVLCAVVIAAISAAVLFAGFDNGFAILRTTREDLRATQILMQKTEAVRLLTWPQLSNCPTTFQEYFYPAGSGATNGGTLYYGTINALGTATNVPDSASYKSNLHLITISLFWTNYVSSNATIHIRQMQTLSAQAGMQSYLWNP
jgi:prepilin-type N-terminal cleavage/methylation domain-containing protein